MSSIKVVVGSTNIVKIEATRSAFQKIFGKVEVEGVKVDSGVGLQPFTNEQTLAGALTRAKNALKKKKADFGVGIEGGIFVTSIGAFVNGWVVVTDGEIFGAASTISVMLPKKVLKLFEENKVKELEEAIEMISGISKPGEKMGAIGVLTNNYLDRKKSFEEAIIAALAPFITNYY